MTWQDKFWSKIRKTHDCWIWLGAKSANKNDQYGKVKIDGKVYRAHRVAFAIKNNLELTFKGYVLHNCDNPQCCNPKHLKLGTHKENMNDMRLRGRAGRTEQIGEKNHNAKLTSSDVEIIRELLNRKLSNKKIAGLFGVTHATISSIKRGKSW